MTFLNETHDPKHQSWVASANAAGTDFPIQNLPFAVFRRKGASEVFRGGVAIGDQILDLAAVAQSGVLKGEAAAAAQAGAQDKLNALMALGTSAWSALRLALSRALREGSADQTALQACLVPQAEAEYELAVQQTQQQARSVWLALQTGPARLLALQAAWKASTARLDATRLGRQVGDRTTLDLLQAENDAAQAELVWLRAQTDLLQTRLQLDALTGQLSVTSLQAINAQLAP